MHQSNLHRTSVRLLAILALMAALTTTICWGSVKAIAQQDGPQVSVENATLKIIVYPDGAVKPVYSLSATVLVPDLREKGSISLSYRSELRGNSSSEKASLIINVEKPNEPWGKLESALHATVKARIVKGEGWLYAELRVNDTSSGPAELIVNASRVSLKGSKAIIEGYLVAYPVNASETQRAPSPSEINAALESAGLGYVRVEKLTWKFENDKVWINFRIIVDLTRMADTLAPKLQPEEAEKLRQLLSNPVLLEAISMEGSLQVKVYSNKLLVNGAYISTARGDIEAYQAFSRELSSLLSKAMQAATMQQLPAGGKLPNELLALLVLQRMFSAGTASNLEAVQPSTSTLELKVRLDSGKATVYVDYEGHRMAVPGEDLTARERAEKTLTILSVLLSQYKNSLRQLSQFVKGVEGLLPGRVELSPSNPSTVRVSKTIVPIEDLPAVKVEIAEKPAAAPETTAPQPGHTTTQPAATTAAKTENTSTGAGGIAANTTMVLAVSLATLAVAVVVVAAVYMRRR